MPDVKFLEEYQLYRKFDLNLEIDTSLFPISLSNFPDVVERAKE